MSRSAGQRRWLRDQRSRPGPPVSRLLRARPASTRRMPRGANDHQAVSRIERGHEFVRRLETVSRGWLEALWHDSIERLRHPRIERARRRRRALQSAASSPDIALPPDLTTPLPSDQHVVENQAERIDVDSLVDRLARAPVPAPCTRACRLWSRPRSACCRARPTARCRNP